MLSSGLLPDWFAPSTQAWFAAAFEAPTAAQLGAWQAIHRNQHTLVVAPTGSGKTLAAFLSALDRLVNQPVPEALEQRCRVVYVSPLKALATDVERNLRAPLAGISHQMVAQGSAAPQVKVGVRTGDTPAKERRSFGAKPPDILITTPESLFLVLSSSARAGLAGVDTVILDEVHALAGTKRGAHLALSLERLDALLKAPAQRVALSATVRPVPEVARFVGGAVREGRRSVEVVQPPQSKVIDLKVQLPVEDLTDLSASPSTQNLGYGPSPHPNSEHPPPVFDAAGDTTGGGSIWPRVHQAVVDQILAHRSTLVFTNSRRAAERLAARINQEYAERLSGQSLDPSAVQTSDQASGASTALAVDYEIALAHHGSMSRERRRHIENQLKAGLLPAVVATSSLELGIDMGAIDLVIQVSAPPSAAAGLQRVGRAGHQVGAVSQGLIYPVFRGDLIPATVTAQRMREGLIEAIRIPANPLDVLAQQIVAMVAMEPWTVDRLAEVVRGAAPYQDLGERSLEAVLDMLSGRYPSTDLAELKPRLVWDRDSGELTARPGAAYLARVSGGTIPDRGLYGVYLAGEQADPKSAKRVGELDEEMVYESRVGDTFTLGSSTWRIHQITPNAVYVTPAPGLPGRLPFWRGEGPGRPWELGQAVGRFIRQIAALSSDRARQQLEEQGLDAWAAANLVSYLEEQRQAAGFLPDDKTLVVERFPDQLGDTRIMIHSLAGGPVNGAWAAVLSARMQESYGLDAQVMPHDDGIMLRLPETAKETDLDLFLPSDDVPALVTAAISGTGRFAARFREAAARALVLPRAAPGKRQPLWQQRHRAQQLLGLAAQFQDFPLVLEAIRETLQDDFDVPALVELMRGVEQRQIRVVQVQTPAASPFAASVAFGYTAQFLYDADAPLAEKRSAALSLDPAMLAELLGSGPASDLAELLDPEVVLALDTELARTTPLRQATSAEALADLLQTLGPLNAEQVEQSSAGPGRQWLDQLMAARRVMEVRLGGQTRWAVVADAAALRDGLGVALPQGLPEAFLTPVSDPLGALIRRYIRNHGPFTAAQLAENLGLGIAVAERELDALAGRSAVRRGRLRPSAAGGTGGPDYCDPEVLTRLRRRSLAALRRQVEPVEGPVLAAFAPIWQQVDRLRGADAVLAAVTGLAGAAIPASAVESLVLPARVADYAPAALDELIAAGEVAWVGEGRNGTADGTVRLLVLDTPDAVLAEVEPPVPDSVAAQLLRELMGGGAFRPFELAERIGVPVGAPELRTALWDLVWGGWVTADSWAPLRAFLTGGKPAHRVARRPPRGRAWSRRATNGMDQTATRMSPVDPQLAGRWGLAPTPAARGEQVGTESRLAATAAALLERYGVVTRGAAAIETAFAQIYPALSALEEAGAVRRGYFVEHLGGSQFALPPVPDQLRAAAEFNGTVVLAATDPANVYGAALPWPEHQGTNRPGRKAGATVVLVDGKLVFYLERGGRTVLSFESEPARLRRAAQALAQTVDQGRLGSLKIARIDGQDALHAQSQLAPSAHALVEAGFTVTPAGLTKRRR